MTKFSARFRLKKLGSSRATKLAGEEFESLVTPSSDWKIDVGYEANAMRLENLRTLR
ncbi:hypothetical protein [Sphingomonas radiodurans]|uniref:hypothetical protein n=1 Tax=Sphingomonas radiodurans TaxID=2890321 RepID=UPI001E5B481F|nr:hypothetical protein [Sphingomonas radiodurans]WBH17107.1 hypothetical protein LLW23_03020 [Sphingomonas radiodurans]